MILLRQADAQSSVYRLHFCLGWIYFLGKLMDGLDIGATLSFVNLFLPTSKDH